jgi:hypothetical protein
MDRILLIRGAMGKGLLTAAVIVRSLSGAVTVRVHRDDRVRDSAEHSAGILHQAWPPRESPGLARARITGLGRRSCPDGSHSGAA